MMDPQPSPPPKKPSLAVALVAGLLLITMFTAIRLALRSHGYGDIWDQRSAGRRASRLAAERSRALAAMPPVPGREYAPLSCAEMADLVAGRAGLSSAEAAARYREQYEGRWVRWAAGMTDVSGPTRGRMLVQFRCSEHTMLMMDGAAWFDASQRAPLDALSRNDVFAFEGQLGELNGVVGPTVFYATLIP